MSFFVTLSLLSQQSKSKLKPVELWLKWQCVKLRSHGTPMLDLRQVNNLDSLHEKTMDYTKWFCHRSCVEGLRNIFVLFIDLKLIKLCFSQDHLSQRKLYLYSGFSGMVLFWDFPALSRSYMESLKGAFCKMSNLFLGCQILTLGVSRTGRPPTKNVSIWQPGYP